jgi:dephospho-CoA kinase
LGNEISYGIVAGGPLSGKTTISNALSNLVQGKVISFDAMTQSVKKSMGTDEEPFEGEVPKEKVCEALLK